MSGHMQRTAVTPYNFTGCQYYWCTCSTDEDTEAQKSYRSQVTQLARTRSDSKASLFDSKVCTLNPGETLFGLAT